MSDKYHFSNQDDVLSSDEKDPAVDVTKAFIVVNSLDCVLENQVRCPSGKKTAKQKKGGGPIRDNQTASTNKK